MLHQRIASPDGDASRRPHMSRLRDETSTAHASVEASFAPFMAEPARHLTRFLSAQLTAMRALAAHMSPTDQPQEAAILGDLVAALAAELGHPRGPVLPVGLPLSADATAYLVLGSRLGTEVIKRHLATHDLPCPRAFSAPPPKAEWQSFRTRINALDADGAALDTLIHDAKRGFGFFRIAASLNGFDAQEGRI